MEPVRRVPRSLKGRLLTNSLATTWSWWSNNSLVTAGLAVTGSFFILSLLFSLFFCIITSGIEDITR